jgi:hypothetical protein
VDEADPGDTIVLEWKSSGGTAAVLYSIPPSGQLPQSGWEVAPTGVYTVDISADERNQSRFSLYVSDEAGRWASTGVTVKLRCPAPWFFSPAPDVCASDPVFSSAAEQHFEHGAMIWIEEQDTIFVLYDNDYEIAPGHQWEQFIDTWDEDQPEHDPALTPPDGLYQPVRGFGLVWRQQPYVRDRLGWAVDKEIGFNTVEQWTTLYKYNSGYFRALDGNIWCLGPERSSWEKIMVSEQ